MRRRILLALLVGVPLLVLPWARSFDTPKAFLLTLGAIVLAASALGAAGPGGGRLVLRWSIPSAAMGAFVLLAGAAALRGTDPWAAARAFVPLLAAAVVALAVENLLTDADEIPPYLGAVALAQGIASGYGLLQAAGVDFPFPWRDTHPGVPASTLGNPNFAAEFTAAALPLTALLAWRRRGGVPAAWLLLGVLFLAVARGRAALLGLGAGTGAAIALGLAARPGLAARIAGGACAAALAAGLFLGARFAYSRAGDLPAWAGRGDTILVRAELANATGRMLRDHPAGVGLGGWEAALPPYRTETEYRASLFREPGEAHHDPLQLAAEGGWALAFAALAWASAATLAAWGAARSGRDRGTATALFASLAAILACSLASAPFHRPATLLLFAFDAGALAFLGGGRESSLRFTGGLVHRLVLLLLVAGLVVQGSALLGEGAVAEGRSLAREGKAAEAYDVLRAGIGKDPGNVEALSLAGVIALKAGRAEEARDLFEAELRLRPHDPLALSNVAHAHALLGQDATAVSTWRRALGIAPWHREANAALGIHLLRRGDPGAALPRLRSALSADPRYVPAAAAEIEALAALGRIEEAIAAADASVNRALEARPRDTADARGLAEAAARSHDLLARMLLVKGRRLLAGPDPEGGTAVLWGAAAGRPTEDVLEDAGRAFALAGRRAEEARMRVEARFAAAEAALSSGDPERADAEAARAASILLPPSDGGRVRVRQASVLLRAGKREKALGALGEAAARGFRDAPSILADPAFAPLRDDPVFRRILAGMPGAEK